MDFFYRGQVVYPHLYKGRILHFTMKDPEKKREYQLPNEFRDRKWMFYNQGVLDQYNDVILVEGENDLQSLIDAKYYNTIAQIGQTSEQQIKALGVQCRKKRLFLWLDNDAPNKKGKRPGHEYVRKICKALPDLEIRVILYPDDMDPDEYIRGLKGDKRAGVQELLSKAVDYISWEIVQAGRNEDLEGRLASLKENKVFEAISLKPDAEQEVYSEKLQKIGFSEKAVKGLLQDRLEIRRKLAIYLETLPDRSKADPNVIANIIHNSLSVDGRFFFDREARVYLLYERKIYEVGNNRPFNALMKKQTMLLPTQKPGNSVWESLASEGYNSGQQIDLDNWIATDDATDTIFINFNATNNSILRINRAGISEVPNGMNDEGVLLRSSNLIRPFTYLPDVDVREAFSDLKRLVFDNLTCDPEQRYFIMCWFISAFLFDFTESQALMKFAGASASGKSTGAKLLTLLLYGDKQVGAPSAAAAFSEASQNPLLVIDNLETEDITKPMKNFLLLAASKNSKTKRTAGTESGTTKESPKSLVLITAIEPFPKAEMINRTIEIEFSRAFQTDDFVENEVSREIIKKRDAILSGILKLISKRVLPNLEKRRGFMTILQKEYKGHSKSRLNDHLSIMMLILEAALPLLPFYAKDDFLYGMETGEAEIRKQWIEYQNRKAHDIEVGSNDIVKLLDGIVREYTMRMKDKELTLESRKGFDLGVFCYQDPEYGLEMVKTPPREEEEDGEIYWESFLEFEATSGDIVPALNMYCKNYGLRNPYPSTAVFGSRLKNDRETLHKAGWELVTKDGESIYSRRVKGQRYFKFRKRLIVAI